MINIKERSIAFKLTSESVETVVTHIDWKLSSRGRYIPVINYNSVYLQGTQCSRVSGYNYKFVRDNKIGQGSKICLTKSGDIIPYITEILSEGDYQDPSFTEDVELDGVHLVQCKTEDLVYRRLLTNYCKNSFEFDGFRRGELISDYIINHSPSLLFEGLFELKEELSKSGITKLSSTVIDTFKFKKLYLNEFLLKLGLDGYGLSSHKKLASYEGIILEHIKSRSYSELNELLTSLKVNRRVIGSIMDEYTLESVRKILDLFKDRLVEESSTSVSSDSSMNIKVVITGKLSKSKSEYKKLLSEIGGVDVVPSLSKDVDYLITDSRESNSNKMKYAISNNIPILLEEEVNKKFFNN